MTHRQANLIDIYKLLASIGIVWFHSNYVNQMVTYDHFVYQIKELAFSWALPFFYSTMAVFALRSNLKKEITFRKRFDRIKRLLFIIGYLIVSYEALKYIKATFYGRTDYQIFPLLNYSSFTAFVGSAWYLFKTVNYSAGYYFFYALIIYLYAVLISIICKGKNGFLFVRGFLLFILVLFFSDLTLETAHKISQIILVDRLVGLLSVTLGFLYATFFATSSAYKKIILSNLQLVILLVMPLLSFSLLKIYFDSKSYSLIVFTGFFVLTVLKLGDVFSNIKNSWGERLARMGQKYSLGIFIIHPLIMAFWDNIVPYFFSQIGVPNEMIIFVSIYLLGLSLSYILVKKIYEYNPQLITLS